LEGWTYSKAGVDLNEHREMHKFAQKIMEEISKKLGIKVNFEGYGSSVKIGNMNLVMHMDGVGTKTIVLEELNKLDVAGWDCVAMNVNDVACVGSRPVLLTDYISMPKAETNNFSKIIEGIREASEKAKVLLVGGETAILPDLVNGIDVICTVLAVKESFESFKGMGEVNDVLVGIKSNGPHANGYSLIRKILKSSFGKYDVIVDDFNLGEWLTRPTAIYSELILEAAKAGLIGAAAHITGGAFSKLKRIIPPNGRAYLRLKTYDNGFEIIRKLGNVSLEEMYRVFNMGIGLILSTKKNHVDDLLSLIEKRGFEGFLVGEVVNGNGGVIIETEGGKKVEL